MSAQGGVVTQDTMMSPSGRVLFVVTSGVFWLLSVITELAFPAFGLPGAMGEFVRANALAFLLPGLVAAFAGGFVVTMVYSWVLSAVGGFGNIVMAIVGALVVGIVTTVLFAAVFDVLQWPLVLWMSLIVTASLFCGWMSARSSQTAHAQATA